MALAMGVCAGLTARAADPATDAIVSQAHRDDAGRIQLDVHFDCSQEAPLTALEEAGLSVSASLKSGTLCVVEGWAQPAQLTRLRAVAGVTRITAPSYVQHSPTHFAHPVSRSAAHASAQKQGTAVAIDHNGVTIMRADQFVSQTSATGVGVTVGVQSSGIYTLATIQARGELPSSIKVVNPAGNTAQVYDDEGTVLLEEVHAVAPGAQLAYCGPTTFVDYVSCLTQLINAGAIILVDDTTFTSDGVMSLDNDQTSAVTQVLTANPKVLIFSSAGNNEGSYWEGSFSPVPVASTSLPALSCPSGSGTPDMYVAAFGSGYSQTLHIGASGRSFPLLFAWADPLTALTSRFDVYWFAAGSTTASGCFSTANLTTNQYVGTLNGLAQGDYTLVVAAPDASASGKFLKLWAGGDGLTTLSPSTSGGLISPQLMAQGVLTVGAVDGSDGVGANIESFSSQGPLNVAFPTATALQAPHLVAPDGVIVDASGTLFSPYSDGTFRGTSAASPNAAGVAALLRSAFPKLSVPDVTTALETGAAVLGASAPNDVYGYGRVDALGALGTLPAPTITALLDQTSTHSATTTAQSLTVTGTGDLHFTVTSSNTALVPSSVVAAGSPGVTVSAGCGTTTLTCTVSVTPVTGQSGTATLSIAVVDGAQRAGAAQLTLTASDPAPATGGAGSGTGTTASKGGGGGAIPLWMLAMLGIGIAVRHAARH